MARQSHTDSVVVWSLVFLGLVVAGALERGFGWWRRAPHTGAFGETRSSDEPFAVQEARAAEPGRGREATSPGHIPLRGWIDIFWRVYAGIVKHRILAIAGGVAFYELLAIFPGISALVSIYGFFARNAQFHYPLTLLADIVPDATLQIIRDQIDRIVAKGAGSLGTTFVFSLGLSLWSANAGVKAMFDALNVIYDEDEKRNFVKLNLISMTFTLCVMMFLMAALTVLIALPPLLALWGIGQTGPISVATLRWPLLYVVVAFGLSVLYRFGPSRRPAKWRWLSVGSLVGALAWLIVSFGASWYVAKIADYTATYGSLAAAIGLLMWLWLTAIVVLSGAQLNAEIEHQTARDSTVGSRERPLGERQAVMADTVGAAQG